MEECGEMKRCRTAKGIAGIERIRLQKECAKWAKVEIERWAEVDALAESAEGPTKPTDATFGALVPWDGVDVGPEWC
ncbi:hypothetical protein B2J88_00385 [Rhodococcus sp. SRB_17]|nr:hypothetical protein [Rhodococcus sp. SRB_17]